MATANPIPTPNGLPDAIDLSAVVTIGELSRLLRTSIATIKRSMQRGKFPIPPIGGTGNRYRFWGPAVYAHLTAQQQPPREAITEHPPRVAPPPRPKFRRRPRRSR